MNRNIFILIAVAFLAFGGGFLSARAAVTPTLSLSNYQNGNSAQITVYADANAAVQLYYLNQYSQYSNYAAFAGTIGYTNYNGYFYSSINGNYNNIPANSLVYVVVDGAESPQVLWPGYTNYNNYNPYPVYNQYQTLSLSQNSLYLNTGQSGSVSVYGNGNYYLSNYSNSSVASASISGNILNVYAYGAGSSNISVCENGGSCAVLYVSVTAPYVAPAPIFQYYPTPQIPYRVTPFPQRPYPRPQQIFPYQPFRPMPYPNHPPVPFTYSPYMGW